MPTVTEKSIQQKRKDAVAEVERLKIEIADQVNIASSLRQASWRESQQHQAEVERLRRQASEREDHIAVLQRENDFSHKQLTQWRERLTRNDDGIAELEADLATYQEGLSCEQADKMRELRRRMAAEDEVERLKGQQFTDQDLRAIVRVAVATFNDGLKRPDADASVYPAPEVAALVKAREIMAAKPPGPPDCEEEKAQFTWGQSVSLKSSTHPCWCVTGEPRMMVRVIPVLESGNTVGRWVRVEDVTPLPPSPPTCKCGACVWNGDRRAAPWVWTELDIVLGDNWYCPKCGSKLSAPSASDEPGA